MLTDERLKELHDYQFALIVLDEPEKAADAMNELLTAYRTLQQQNAQMKEALETAIMWFQGDEMFIKSQQLRKMLDSIQGGLQ